MPETLNITVPNEMMEVLRGRVKAGVCASTEEAVLAAIASMVSDRDTRDDRLDLIRARISASLDDPGPSLASSDVRRRLDELYARHCG